MTFSVDYIIKNRHLMVHFIILMRQFDRTVDFYLVLLNVWKCDLMQLVEILEKE